MGLGACQLPGMDEKTSQFGVGGNLVKVGGVKVLDGGIISWYWGTGPREGGGKKPEFHQYKHSVSGMCLHTEASPQMQ